MVIYRCSEKLELAAGDDLLLGIADDGVQFGRRLRIAKLFEKCFVAEEASQSGQDLQVSALVGADDQKEEVGQIPRSPAESNPAGRSSKSEE